MRVDDCADKFRDCAAFVKVASPLAAQVIDRVSAFGKSVDVSESSALLA